MFAVEAPAGCAGRVAADRAIGQAQRASPVLDTATYSLGRRVAADRGSVDRHGPAAVPQAATLFGGGVAADRTADDIDSLNPYYEGMLGAGRINARACFTTGINDQPNLSYRFKLLGNYPNRFNNSTNIGFVLPQECRVKLEVFDILGRRVATLADEVRPAGYHNIVWDASEASSGMYFYRMRANDFQQTKSMTLLK